MNKKLTLVHRIIMPPILITIGILIVSHAKQKWDFPTGVVFIFAGVLVFAMFIYEIVTGKFRKE
jgi:cytochrome c oxidase subunit IV